MSQSANDLIMGGESPSAKFPSIGTTVKGQVVDTAVSQQRDFGTGDPKFWKDGSPMMQAVITLQTDERDPGIPDDDGKRRLFVSSRRMREAVREAVRNAGARHIEIGGKLAVQYTGDGEPTGDAKPPHLYVAQYKPPAPGAVATDLLGDGSYRTSEIGHANEEPF